MGSVPASGTHVCTMIYISYMCATGRLHTLDDTPAWSAQASWPCKLWWQQISRVEAILSFIAVWDDVWMNYALSLDQKKTFSPQGARITPWWVSSTLCLGWWSCKSDLIKSPDPYLWTGGRHDVTSQWQLMCCDDIPCKSKNCELVLQTSGSLN